MDIKEKIFEICIELSGCGDITEDKYLQDDLQLCYFNAIILKKINLKQKRLSKIQSLYRNFIQYDFTYLTAFLIKEV